MNLAELKERLSKSRTVIRWGDSDWTVAPLTLGHAERLAAIHEAKPRDEHGRPTSASDAAEFFGAVLSLAAVDAEGNRCFDSAEGRATLAELPKDELLHVAQEVLRLNGMASEIEDAKKNGSAP